MKKRSTLCVLAAVALAGTVVAVTVGANRQPVVGANRSEALFSATQIILLPGGNSATDSNIARFDATTGAIYRYRGNVDNQSTSGQWEIRVPPVDGPTSGMMELQHAPVNPFEPNENAPAATFLVDMVTGNTWLLRQRGSSNLAWTPVEIFRGGSFSN